MHDALNRRRVGQAVPLPVTVTMVYVGVSLLWIEHVHGWLSTLSPYVQPTVARWVIWLHYGGDAQVRWSFAVVGFLLVLYLWVQCRELVAVRAWPQAASCILAAALVLALQWLIVVAFETVPRYVLVRIHP